MLHVRLCTIRRENADEALGFELWRSRRKSSGSASPPEHDQNSDLLIVKSVYPDSPAEKGDLRENDKIIAVDGTNVRDAKTVRDLLTAALEVRVMVERWEGPKPKTANRKSSTPSAPQMAIRAQAQAPESNRRRSNTLRSEPNPNIHQWPRNYGSTQNYPNQSSEISNQSSSSATAQHLALQTQVDSAGDDGINDSEEVEEPRRSILDVCPEGRFLLNIAGRGFYSDDLRGD